MPPTNEQPINNVWGKQTPLGVAERVTVPSGQTCMAKRIGMEGMMQAGILGDADSLTEVVGRKHIRRVRGGKGADTEELNMQSVLKDPEALKAMVMLCDRAVPVIVEEPKVALHFVDKPDGTTERISEEDRKDDLVYTDQVGLEDKMFLFQFAVGGTRDLERFRQQSHDAVAGVGHGENVPRATKRSSPRKR